MESDNHIGSRRFVAGFSAPLQSLDGASARTTIRA
jgi:hypothetical protein